MLYHPNVQVQIAFSQVAPGMLAVGIRPSANLARFFVEIPKEGLVPPASFFARAELKALPRGAI